MSEPYKICAFCAHRWERITDLVRDENLCINGYQASYSDSFEGLFLFTHKIAHCGTTFGVRAGDLRALYDGPDYKVHMAMTEQCNAHCMRIDDLSECSNECDMRWVRDIIQILKKHGPEEVLQKLEKTSTADSAVKAVGGESD